MGLVLFTFPGKAQRNVEAPAERISRVENGLLPPAYPKGKSSAGMNILARMQHYGVTGLSVAVISNGRIDWQRGYGLLEAGKPDPVTPQTLFQAASISKPLAAMAALRLVQEGKMSLDGDLNDQLSSWKIPESEFTVDRKVTLRGALTHNAGLASSGLNTNGYAVSDSLPTITQILRGKSPANTPPILVKAVPGTNPEVASEGYCIVQQALEDVTAASFPAFMKSAILDKLRMTRSTFNQVLPADVLQQAASGHFKGKILDGKWKLHPAMAAAGLWSTPADVANFIIDIHQTYTGKSERVLSRRMVEQMLAPQPGNPSRGIGFYVHGEGKNTVYYHRGWNQGFTSYAVGFAESGHGVVMMTNADTEGYKLMMELVRSIGREYNWPSDVPFELAAPREVSAIALDEKEYQAYAGEYLLEGRKLGRVFLENGNLYLQTNKGQPVPLYPETKVDFFSEDGTEVLFAIEGGRLQGMVFKDPFYPYFARKVDAPAFAR